MNEDEKNCNKILGIFVCFIYFFISLFALFVFGISRVDAATTFEMRGWGCGSSTYDGYDNSYVYRTCKAGSTWVNADFQNFSGSFQSHAKFELRFNDSNNSYGYKSIHAQVYINGQPQSGVTASCPVSGNTAICDVYFNGLILTDSAYTIQLQLTGTYFTSNSFQAIVSGSVTYDSASAGLNNGTFQQGVNGIINNQNQNKQDIIDNQNKNTQDIINSNKQTQDKLDDVNSSLNDSNIDDSLNSAGNFFNSFEDKDHGGLSGIITAPLVAINKMLSKECTALTASYEGKEFSVPSGCDFWSRITEVQDFLNLVEGGLLCYLIIRQMFLLVQSLKNPEEDRVEVMDL